MESKEKYKHPNLAIPPNNEQELATQSGMGVRYWPFSDTEKAKMSVCLLGKRLSHENNSLQ
jgi:hypothetical protein